MRARFAVILAVALAASGAVAETAAALPPGVFVDPGSPAGKEYGVPLSDLRGAASGHVSVGNETAPLFGIGISPPVAARPTALTRGSVRRSRNGQGVASGHGGAAKRAANRGVAASGPTGAPAGGAVLAGLTRHGSSAPAVILIEGLVVIGGLGAGAALIAARRRLD